MLVAVLLIPVFLELLTGEAFPVAQQPGVAAPVVTTVGELAARSTTRTCPTR